MKVDTSDPRVEGLAKHLAKKKLISMTRMEEVASFMPDAMNSAMEKVWARSGPEDEVIRNKFRNEAVDIISYLDTVGN